MQPSGLGSLLVSTIELFDTSAAAAADVDAADVDADAGDTDSAFVYRHKRAGSDGELKSHRRTGSGGDVDHRRRGSGGDRDRDRDRGGGGGGGSGDVSPQFLRRSAFAAAPASPPPATTTTFNTRRRNSFHGDLSGLRLKAAAAAGAATSATATTTMTSTSASTATVAAELKSPLGQQMSMSMSADQKPSSSSSSSSSSTAPLLVRRPSKKFVRTRVLASMSREDQVEDMKTRARANQSFVYVKVPSFIICATYKGGIVDLNNLVVTLPVLEYHNKTLAWSALLELFRSDCSGHVYAAFFKGKVLRMGTEVGGGTDVMPLNALSRATEEASPASLKAREVVLFGNEKEKVKRDKKKEKAEKKELKKAAKAKMIKTGSQGSGIGSGLLGRLFSKRTSGADAAAAGDAGVGAGDAGAGADEQEGGAN